MCAFRPGAFLSVGLAAVLFVAMARTLRAQDSIDDSLARRRPTPSKPLQLSSRNLMFSSQTCAPNNPDSCFFFDGPVTLNGKKAGLQGQGEIFNSTCQENKKMTMTCCSAAGGETIGTLHGEIFVTFSKMTACQKTNSTTETLSTSFKISGGNGSFNNASGSGRETLTDSATTGRGSVSAQGVLK
jgi:hypothetical protein